VLNLRLLPILQNLKSALEGGLSHFEKLVGVSCGDNELLVREVISQTLAMAGYDHRDLPWVGYLAADDTTAVVIGTCAFVNSPDATGLVELAYYTFPSFEGRGYATAMAHHLVDLSVATHAVKDVVALTLPMANASTRVLEKVGFKRAGVAMDPDQGELWRWVFPVGS